jgi:hypothetical protein
MTGNYHLVVRMIVQSAFSTISEKFLRGSFTHDSVSIHFQQLNRVSMHIFWMWKKILILSIRILYSFFTFSAGKSKSSVYLLVSNRFISFVCIQFGLDVCSQWATVAVQLIDKLFLEMSIFGGKINSTIKIIPFI